ncbi:2-oxo-4-hydroxy-4-carboxy-5-ureidoimidazoline decarboxylase [Streptosporangium sp. NPDC000563]|uniref:2-oxo-4-hydroxy-4-carboxy-5-ureidoimidazoline decarboxylase n=1 Tax=Streptosporangium sp. NPDC000563 TaxID=3154366 RepID=UPI00331730B6
MPNVNSAPPVSGLAAFNALGAEEAEAGLLACCACRTFAREVAASRPYRDLDRLAETAEAVVRGLDWSGVREALAAHPRIGEPPRAAERSPAEEPSREGGPVPGPGPADRPEGHPEHPEHPERQERPEHSEREAAWSRGEQAGVDTAGKDVLDRLAEGNRAYERRFGHVYLICATGLSAEEMLARLTERLGNDEDTERDVVRTELAKITRLRLAKLLGAAP